MNNKTNPARQAYLKRWRKEHPDKISKYNKQYWERRLMREQMQEKENQNHGNNKAVSDD